MLGKTPAPRAVEGTKQAQPRMALRHCSLLDLAGWDGKRGLPDRKGFLERGKYNVGISGARIMACFCNRASLGTDLLHQQISAGESPSAGFIPIVGDKH